MRNNLLETLMITQKCVMPCISTVSIAEDEPWNQLESLWSDTWYIDCPLDVAMQRIFARQTGNGLTPEASLARIQGNDRPNGQVVATSKQRARLVVPSLPFKELR
jgi:pantothenate kinase